MRKKIFLGAYINVINAQNINCKSIAFHLDKNKYSVKSLVLGDKNIENLDDVSFIKVSTLGYKISNLFAFIKGVLWADLCYVPKHQSTLKLALKLAKLLDKKTFTTIEGNMCDTGRRNMIDSFGSLGKMRDYFSLISHSFGITSEIIKKANCGIKLEQNPLYLGVESNQFSFRKTKKKLNNIVFIGSLLKTKNLDDFISIANLYPDLNFHIIGDGPIKEYLIKKSSKNVTFHGKLNHFELSRKLANMDLHFLPSRSEGFPKVVLETASSSIPSILYNDYGADSWINHSENGFVVSNFEEVKNTIDNLIKNPEILIRNSENVLELAEKFDWKIIIKSWEKVIDNLK
ncbi:MAG: glycosyltransferase family 4 protein [Flavobacteriales bacterium]|nr:glycosyltransferase family 4 protein [Flavobacteriales bacterium]